METRDEEERDVPLAETLGLLRSLSFLGENEKRVNVGQGVGGVMVHQHVQL